MNGEEFVDVWQQPLRTYTEELERLKFWNRSEFSGRNSFFHAEAALELHVVRLRVDIARYCAPWFDNSAFDVFGSAKIGIEKDVDRVGMQPNLCERMA